jgi:hypothetical protein
MILLARFTPHKNTPSAWIMAPVPSPVLIVGHFRRNLLVYSCQAPKNTCNSELKNCGPVIDSVRSRKPKWKNRTLVEV